MIPALLRFKSTGTSPQGGTMKRLLGIVMTSGLVFLLAGNAVGQTTVTLNPTDDAKVVQYNPTQNYGASAVLNVCTYDGHPTHNDDFEQNTYVKFDISSIPAGATINSATLYLYYYHWHDNDPAGRVLTGWRVAGGWSEGTITYAMQPPVTGPTTSSPVPAAFGWMSWDVTGDVAFFAGNPGMNNGWKIRDNNAWNQFNIPIAYFRAKEHGSDVPYLEVNYSEPSGCWLNCPAGPKQLVNAAGSGDKSPDMDGNGTVNLVDDALFAAAWPPGAYDYCADFDCSGNIGLQDLALFAQHWGHLGPIPGYCI
jgi:hypothetical protein